jgi:hypothetical protein
MADHFHIAVAWDWEHDREFVSILETIAQKKGLRSFSVSHHNTHEALRAVQRGELSIGAFLDRSADTDPEFAALARALRRAEACFINQPDAVAHATDKATMHLEFLTKGIHVPFTIIISPYNKRREVELTISDLAQLERPFIIKPANTTGGGIGVILGAESLKDVIDSRQHHKNDKYLLQKKIVPVTLNGRKAWFRVFWVFDTVIPCWWDDQTHVYAPVTEADRATFGLAQLWKTTRAIAGVCRLGFFSTEIALTREGTFVVVDYVNDVCDMRLQSLHPDGVPDAVVEDVCRGIIGKVTKLPSA